MKTGTTLAVLRAEGKIPVWIERLKIFAKISEISIKTVLRIVFGILKGPVDLGPKEFMVQRRKNRQGYFSMMPESQYHFHEFWRELYLQLKRNVC